MSRVPGAVHATTSTCCSKSVSFMGFRSAGTPALRFRLRAAGGRGVRRHRDGQFEIPRDDEGEP